MTAYEVATAQVKAAEEQLRSAESQKLTQVSNIKQKEATAAMAELNYQYMKIFAPVDGTAEKNCAAGKSDPGGPAAHGRCGSE